MCRRGLDWQTHLLTGEVKGIRVSGQDGVGKDGLDTRRLSQRDGELLTLLDDGDAPAVALELAQTLGECVILVSPFEQMGDYNQSRLSSSRCSLLPMSPNSSSKCSMSICAAGR